MKLNTTVTLMLFLITIMLIAGCGQQYKAPANPIDKYIPDPEQVPVPPDQQTTEDTNDEEPALFDTMTVKNIEITSSGFSPNTVTIEKGTYVIFVNKESRSSWPASAIHPTHKVYPNSDIEKCGTSEETLIFDACKGLAEGESHSFKFDEKGTWKYHDHLKPGFTGTIIVQ